MPQQQPGEDVAVSDTLAEQLCDKEGVELLRARFDEVLDEDDDTLHQRKRHRGQRVTIRKQK